MFRPGKQNKNERLPLKKEAVVLPLHTGSRSLDLLISLVKKIRPLDPKDFQQAETNFKAVLYQLSQDKTALFSLRKALLSQFVHTNIVTVLTESGIVSSRGFVQELLVKFKHRLLPGLQGTDNFLFLIDKVFYKKNDHIWVGGIDIDLWIQFFELPGMQINLAEPGLTRQLLRSMQMLSYRVATQGLEKEITHRYENFEDAVYPFLEQNRLVNEYIHFGEGIGATGVKRTILDNLTEALHNCNQSIHWIREQRSLYGTSLAQTYILTRLQQQVERLFIILDVIDTENHFNTERFVEYFKTVVYNENKRNSITEFLSENTGLLAYQIAEHGGKTGEKYITTTRKEFWMMTLSAAGGGIIISFIGVVKNLLAKVQLAPLWQGFLYSANYSLGFILIQDTGSTLATKQPAYTANNVASSFDSKKTGEHPDLRNLAITVAKVSRTQLASFAGNLLIVFPLTFLLAWLFYKATGTKIAEGEMAEKLLLNQQPFQSFAWLYACFTGFFLFLSGLIAGYVENYVVYGKIAERIKQLRYFRSNLSEKNQYKIVRYVEHSLGALSGNISLGFFLGMAAFFGHIFGIPFDIRHVTISAANASIGFFGLDHTISYGEIAYTLTGIAGIGFLNFAVSFGCAFVVAVKSRGIHLREYPEFLGIFWRYCKKYPGDFFKAPLYRKAEDLI